MVCWNGIIFKFLEVMKGDVVRVNVVDISINAI